MRSQRHGTVCSRNIIDFINFKEFVCEEEFVITESNLARKTFSKIPAQFIDYMTRRNIKPNKEKKGLKTAKA